MIFWVMIEMKIIRVDITLYVQEKEMYNPVNDEPSFSTKEAEHIVRECIPKELKHLDVYIVGNAIYRPTKNLWEWTATFIPKDALELSGMHFGKQGKPII